jgi:NAD(P)-dependent dehydrogenase (short-subunit alcohol dehydrogenase family)
MGGIHMNKRFDLTGRVAFVTGGATGIGLAGAEVFAEAGAHVHIIDRDEATLAEAQKTLEAKGIICTTGAGDVTESQAVDAAVSEVVARHGRLDICFANAGIGDPVKSKVHETTDENWSAIVDVNLNGVFYTCRAALRTMLTQGNGSIITMSSIYGHVAPAGVVDLPGYSATKAAVANLTREMAVSYGTSGVRINALCPGAIRTANRPSSEQGAAALAASAPMKRLGTLEEIKGPLLFLASDASSYMSGSMMMVDGGATAL